MVKVNFEHDGNNGQLFISTHFGVEYIVVCDKYCDQVFRLGGTVINDVMTFEGVITECQDAESVRFKAFKNEQDFFNGTAYLSPENWNKSDLHCYITEYYDLYVDGQRPKWLVSKLPLKDANYIFINLDVLDGGGNIIKRYRASPFFSHFRIMETLHG